MSVGARHVGAGREEPLASSATPDRLADVRDPAPGPHGADKVRSGSTGRRALTVIGAIGACAAAALTCSPGTGTAAAAILAARTGAVHASVQPGPAARI